jgi:hypothetical protein
LLGLTWVGLAPADRASFAGAFLLFDLADRILPQLHLLPHPQGVRAQL